MMGIDFTADAQFDTERMPVQSRALVAGRDIGQTVRGLEREGTENVQLFEMAGYKGPGLGR